MLNLKYNNSEEIYEIEFSKISDHIVEITGDTDKLPIKTNGFTLSRPTKNDNWNYSDFTTIYRTRTFEDSTHVQFSNDESVYVAPPEPEPIPETPYEPTPEELEIIFKQNKMQKIALSKTMLAEYLESNPIHSSVHNNVEGIYSVTNEKQMLIMSQYATYQIEKNINPNAKTKLTWNESWKSCEEWEEEEFLKLILEIKNYVYPLVSYQQHIEERICICTTQEELDKILIDYSVINQT